MKYGILTLVIVAVSYQAFKAYREHECVMYGHEFGVEAHSADPFMGTCAADHWPARGSHE